MIDIQKIHQNNWTQTRISILGAGKSGISAAKLGQYMGSQIFISDKNDSHKIIENIRNYNHEIGKPVSYTHLTLPTKRIV